MYQTKRGWVFDKGEHEYIFVKSKHVFFTIHFLKSFNYNFVTFPIH